MTSTQPFEYVLGSGDHELDRLALQQSVWAEQTEAWLDLLGVQPGACVLDAGCGPGEVLARLAQRVGANGQLVGVDDSERWIEHVRDRSKAAAWPPTELHHGRLETVASDGSFDGRFDGIFCRWVLSFPPDPGALVQRFSQWLKPGGTLVVVDYNHEGISLFPESEGFRAVIRATRAWYESRGGSAFVAGELPRLFRAAGLELTDELPVVRSGRPGTPVWTWAEEFFVPHSHSMEQAGLLTPAEGEAFRAEWAERRQDPDACFYSPIVVGFAARRPGND
ncbi:MAG: methyltransferase domain-containing protein [Planctomycetota bacterium]|jgi:SAM-dependent methyltransferase